jgi:hypothetical protein
MVCQASRQGGESAKHRPTPDKPEMSRYFDKTSKFDMENVPDQRLARSHERHYCSHAGPAIRVACARTPRNQIRDGSLSKLVAPEPFGGSCQTCQRSFDTSTDVMRCLPKDDKRIPLHCQAQYQWSSQEVSCRLRLENRDSLACSDAWH